MKLFLLVAPLAALCGTAVAVPAAGSDTSAAPQTKSKAVVPAQSRFSSFSNFVEDFENALVKDIVNIMTQGKTEDDIRKMRMANSPYFVNIQGIDDVSKFISRVGLGEALNKRSVQAGNPLMNLFGMGMKNGSDSGGGGGGGGGGLKGLLMGGGMGGGGGGGGGGPPIGMGGGGMGGGIKLPDFGRILEKLKDELEKNGPKIMMALKEGGKGLGNLLSVLLPVTALVIKLGLGSLAPLTIIVDALLLALLGLGPTVGNLLLKLGLIGEK